MSGKWGWATCPSDGEPLISTFEFPGAEFVCVVCGARLGFLSPVANKVDDLTDRHAELQAIYDEQRAARRAAVTA